jgi:hypothetical protein
MAPRKTCLCVTLSTTNPKWTDLDAKTGLRGEKPVPNRLSYGTTANLIYTAGVSCTTKYLQDTCWATNHLKTGV